MDGTRPPAEDLIVPLAETVAECARCRLPAACVCVLAPGEPTPPPVIGPALMIEPGAGFLREQLRVVIDADGFGGTIAGSSIVAAAPALERALHARSIADLYAVDPEVARCWCPDCEASYCGRCWILWSVFDDDDPAWFDELRGRCPLGHERQIHD